MLVMNRMRNMDSYSSSLAFVADEDFGNAASHPTRDSGARKSVPAVQDLPLRDHNRTALKSKPLKAWHHFRELLKDKERTEEVFHIFESLPWHGFNDAAIDFCTSDNGKAIMAGEPNLVAILDDHAALRKLPADSVAHAYCDFMEREGLSAQGLVDEYNRFADGRVDYKDQVQWYQHRTRDTHDLLHVLTGYGRDALGEACVLAFTYSQAPSPAHLFIGYMAGLNIKKTVKANAPVLRAIREGQKMGKACPRITEISIRDLLAMPLDEARRMLHITPPTYYAKAHKAWAKGGVDPYRLLATPA